MSHPPGQAVSPRPSTHDDSAPSTAPTVLQVSQPAQPRCAFAGTEMLGAVTKAGPILGGGRRACAQFVTPCPCPRMLALWAKGAVPLDVRDTDPRLARGRVRLGGSRGAMRSRP